MTQGKTPGFLLAQERHALGGFETRPHIFGHNALCPYRGLGEGTSPLHRVGAGAPTYPIKDRPFDRLKVNGLFPLTLVSPSRGEMMGRRPHTLR